MTRSRWPVVTLGAVSMAFLLFSLVPLTQKMDVVDHEEIVFREMAIATLPIVKASPVREPENVEQEIAPLELQRVFEELTLTPLELALNPSQSDALEMGKDTIILDTDLNIATQAKRVFQFVDLEAAPRILSAPRFDFPRSLERRGVRQCKLELLIEVNERGRAKVREIINSSHPEIVSLARRLIERARFSIPELGGKPVAVVGRFPLNLESP